MKPIEVKTTLFDSIQAVTDYKWFFSARPGVDHTRNRKFPFQKMIASILAFKGGTLNHEIMDFYGLDPSIDTASALQIAANPDDTDSFYPGANGQIVVT